MSKQNIHIAMGSLAYAIATADGVIQAEEKAIIKKLAQEEFQLEDVGVEWIEKMFERLEREGISTEEAYNYALDTLESNKFDFDFDLGMKNKCVKFMKRVAAEFADTSYAEQNIIQRFDEDVVKYF